MKLVSDKTLELLEAFFFAPVENPDILPAILPLVLGATVIELYFGKYTQEELGWNSSVANAVIWISTGITLIVGGNVSTKPERYVSYFLIGIGSVTAYLDFYHKWSEQIAFVASSAIPVYTVAYLAVVMIDTGIPINRASIKASVLYIITVSVFFELVKAFERPARDQLGMEFR